MTDHPILSNDDIEWLLADYARLHVALELIRASENDEPHDWPEHSNGEPFTYADVAEKALSFVNAYFRVGAYRNALLALGHQSDCVTGLADIMGAEPSVNSTSNTEANAGEAESGKIPASSSDPVSRLTCRSVSAAGGTPPQIRCNSRERPATSSDSETKE